MKRFLTITLYIVVIFFALVGIAFTAVFLGMQYGVFNVRGSIAARNAFFTGSNTSTPAIGAKLIAAKPCTTNATVCEWSLTPEWAVVSGGLAKDQALIETVASETGVSARIIAATVVPEQIRFFTAEREVFKRYFEPLKILGSLSQFSLGVSGIKQETANQIERHAADPTSPFYPGDGYAARLAYKPGEDHDKALYARLTNDKNHYYSYLYTAIYLKEIQMQWQRAGFDISHNAGILVTLFNIGFEKSIPKAAPGIAGAPITVGGTTYSFGDLGERFYNSEELLAEFPR